MNITHKKHNPHYPIHKRVCCGCGVVFMAKSSHAKYCSRDCFSKNQSITESQRESGRRAAAENNRRGVHRPWDGKTRPEFTGLRHPMFGKKHGSETRKTISQKTKMAWASESVYVGDYFLNQSLGQRVGAQKRPNYRGGITPLNAQVRGCSLYYRWRDAVFKRDDYTCQRCQKRGGYLSAHHKIRFSDIMKRYGISEIDQALACSELWDLGNGETLCKDCHKNEHF